MGRLYLILGLAVTQACCGDRATSPPAIAEEHVVVSPGLQPAIAWTPGERVHSVIVTDAGTGGILWSAQSPALSNAIASPVGYGTTPAGAIATANVINPLHAGTSYRVELFRPGTDGVPRSVGTTTFTP